jgi:hypothetical protein
MPFIKKISKPCGQSFAGTYLIANIPSCVSYRIPTFLPEESWDNFQGHENVSADIERSLQFSWKARRYSISRIDNFA